MKNSILSILAVVVITTVQAQNYTLPDPPAFPTIPEKKQVDEVKMVSLDSFPEVKLDIPIHDGPFEPTWESIEKNYPGTPEWLRDSKFGIWVCYGPQASGESGDWYARNMYKQGHLAYNNHLKRFGHPSQVGYKEVLSDWNPDKLDPEYLTKLYKKAGARFLMIMGVHCDNYDLWNSRYQPWNSVNIGPKRDILGEWDKACRKHGMHYGVTFHNEYTSWWWQTAFESDSIGDKAGVPYDGNLTAEDGKGQWWEGYDPRLLYGVDLHEYNTMTLSTHSAYGQPESGIYGRHLDYCKWFATQWALRIMDVTNNYHPDFIYTDGTSQGPFCGYGAATGYKCNAIQTVIADFYNNTLQKNGKVNTFSIVKFKDPTNGTVNTAEFEFPDSVVSQQSWIREAAIGDWYYAPGFVYDSGSIIRYIIEAVSRDGNIAINVGIKPDGSVDEKSVVMLEEIGDWMKINGQAIYGSRAWSTFGEGQRENGHLRTMPGGGIGQFHKDFRFGIEDLRFTVGKDGALYAFCMEVPAKGDVVRIKSMGRDKNNISVKKVSLLGYHGKIEWRHTADALEITFPDKAELKTSAVFKIQ